MTQTIISGTTLVAMIGVVLHSKWQSDQNKLDINELKATHKAELAELKAEFTRERSANEKRIGDVYELVRDTQATSVKTLQEVKTGIIDKLDDIKEHFVSTRSCDINHGR